MANFWVRDRHGAVVGPVSLDRIGELAAAGTLQAASRVSMNGTTWLPAASVPEIARVLLPPAILAKHAEHRARAQELSTRLERIRNATNEEIFGVPEGASPRQFRKAFIQIARDVHPARLPQDAHPDLLRASMDLFQLLSTRMAQIEQASSPPLPSSMVAPKDDRATPAARMPASVSGGTPATSTSAESASAMTPPPQRSPATPQRMPVPSATTSGVGAPRTSAATPQRTPVPSATTSGVSPPRMAPASFVGLPQPGSAATVAKHRGLGRYVVGAVTVALVVTLAAAGALLWRPRVGVVASTSDGLFVDGTAAQLSQDLAPGARVEARRAEAWLVLTGAKSVWLSRGAIVEITRDADVLVHHGRVRFWVDPDVQRERPFTVQVGTSRVEVLGTVLAVTRKRDEADVRVFKGAVRVVSPAGALHLKGGERTSVKPGAALEAHPIHDGADPDLLQRLGDRLDRVWERFSP